MKIGVPSESVPHESRVALVPDMVKKLVALGIEVEVESGAGQGAFFSDEEYVAAGAKVTADPKAVLGNADLVVKVQPPTLEEAGALREGAVLISFLQPVRDRQVVERLAARRVTALSMHRIPRITRAQTMDALSSQSNIAGYKAVLVGASALAKLLPMMVTAAGTMRPSSVFVLGAGVAGLQAIATARRLGAVVSAFDVRPAVREQVQSLGARFLEVQLADTDTETAGGYAKELSGDSHRKLQELLHDTLRNVDIAITTALIPDKPAPLLITSEMVRDMRAGSVIVDLAAEAGGNCELTEPGQRVIRHLVTIIGDLDLPSTVAVHASQMYSRNVLTLIEEMLDAGEVRIDLDNDVVGPSTITHGGEIRV
jgi:NAD(P) transhydrogenase subunit alpha